MEKQNKRDLNEVLKEREAAAAAEKAKHSDEPMKLDDAARVKVLSPGMMVFKRFMRNKLAIVGSCILIFMFVFSFLAPLVYPYGQTKTFYTHDYINADYAAATIRSEYVSYKVDESMDVDSYVTRAIGTAVSKIEKEEGTQTTLTGKTDGVTYVIDKLGEGVFTIGVPDLTEVASYATQEAVGKYVTLGQKLETADGSEPDPGLISAIAQAVMGRSETAEYNGSTYILQKLSKTEYDILREGDGTFVYAGAAMDEAFESAVLAAIGNGESAVTVDGTEYQLLSADGVSYQIAEGSGVNTAYVATNFVFDSVTAGVTFSEEFKREAALALYGSGAFTADGVDYEIADRDGEILITSGGSDVALVTNVVVRDMLGDDSFSPEFKEAVAEQVRALEESGSSSAVFTHKIPQKQTITVEDENGNTKDTMITVTDENGNTVYEDAEITITRKTGQYILTCMQMKSLIDLNAPPSMAHPFGTDGDGYDVLARMMYGGRVSLMVGFVVVILETILGVIMGGIAGYFGGWVDNLIMRLVDIFYCIPSTPLLIIMGSYMDAAKLPPYTRLMWMMAILGVLGWAGIARLVRGQILSLREQEFMVATEATGITVSRRIFRHLVPNVMPQLIVSATMGLGGVIITESTLSYLGLGVKHPLATWGTMINSVTSSNENMIKFTYIWIPVGLLICLTVIAFNFVGDGLRDAFDPKMKR